MTRNWHWLATSSLVLFAKASPLSARQFGLRLNVRQPSAAAAELGKFCRGGWEQLVLLWADNRSAPGREILPCCCCVDKLYGTAWRSFSPSRAVSVERWYWSLENIICGGTPVVASRPVCLLLAPQSWALPCGPELDTGRKDCWHAGAY